MEIKEFIDLLEEEFEDDITPGTLKPDSRLDDEMEITSVNALILISMVKVEYDVAISAKELRSCKTVNNLYKVVKNKTK